MLAEGLVARLWTNRDALGLQHGQNMRLETWQSRQFIQGCQLNWQQI